MLALFINQIWFENYKVYRLDITASVMISEDEHFIYGINSFSCKDDFYCGSFLRDNVVRFFNSEKVGWTSYKTCKENGLLEIKGTVFPMSDADFREEAISKSKKFLEERIYGFAKKIGDY